jgi:hypothetical protein
MEPQNWPRLPKRELNSWNLQRTTHLVSVCLQKKHEATVKEVKDMTRVSSVLVDISSLWIRVGYAAPLYCHMA